MPDIKNNRCLLNKIKKKRFWKNNYTRKTFIFANIFTISKAKIFSN